MRLDLYLKHTRLISRRTLSKSFIDSGGVLINDKVAKPSSKVKNGDTLTLYLGDLILIVEASIKKDGNTITLGGTIIDKKESGIHKC